MTRRLKKKFKIILPILFILLVIVIVLGINNMSKKINKPETKKETKIEEKKEEPIKEEEMINKDIFNDYYDKADIILNNMTIDEKINQLLIVRVPVKNGLEVMKNNQFGGYILFARDVTNITKEDLINKINSYKEVSKISPIIAIDEEGGDISRLNLNPSIVPTPFKSPKELYNEGGLDLIEEDLKNKNKLLEELGINLNLAPVIDIADEDSFIFDRTISSDVNIVSDYTKRVINTSKLSKVSYVLKHFPGYGNNLDTHKGLSIDERTLDEFRNKDFIPFKRGIEEKAECILVNHNIIKNVEDNIPASLSKNIHNILRDELAFTGIIITDDLYMDAIKEYVDKPSIQAVNAGNDMIIITDYIQGINDIKEALNNGILNEETINTAVKRILAWKYYKGMI